MEDDENLSRPLLSIRPDSNFTSSSSVARLRSSSSECDVVNQEGNYQLREPINSSENNQSAIEIQQNRWDLNYREAAIYLQEGENNDKFSAHPRDQVDLPAYMITHNTWFYLLTLFASLVLLTLALVENPSVMAEPLPISIHASIELVALIIIAIELVLKVKWLGWYSFVRHIRTMIEVVILCIMFAEAITVIVRRTNHFRVTRALRPVFLLDSYYCRGVRRFIRQIIQSLPPIIDMLVLLIFFILLFSMLGFYLFSSMPNDTYFQSIFQSFISLFILLTTANFPDVMMPAYKATKWSSVFFIIYISIELFLFMNLFLAVVYSAFMKIEKEKFKKLLLHRRSACQAAFQLLVSGQNPNFLSCKNFAGCLKYFRPRMRRRDIYLVFKSLNVSHSGKLSAEEFTSIYDVVSLKWKRKSNKDLWSSNFVRPFNRICYGLNRLVTLKWFDYFIYFVIFSNFIWILFDTVRISYCKQAATDSSNYSWYEDEKNFIWVSMVFVVIYVVEAAMKIFGLGPQRYFSSGWNIFDFVVTVVALFGVLLQYANNGFYYIVIIRPLRVLRLFKLKRRYRDVFGTLFILFSRMISLGIVMLLLFYFFAIIGMEVFAPYTSQLKNCCQNTSVEKDYIYNETNGLDGYYYLNTFENLLVSGVTLFELTVVNNWWIIMEGFASVTSPWSRLYFMIFYLIIMVVMTVVVAFVLEAFIFRIQYRQKMQGQGQDMEAYTVKKVDVSLTPDEMRMCDSSDSPLTGRYIPSSQETRQTEILAIPLDDSQFVWFRGQKMLSKRDFSARMYSSEVKEWISNDVNLPSERQTEIPLQPLLNDEVVIV